MPERPAVRGHGVAPGALALAMAAAAGVAAVGCSTPRIQSFTVTPRTICPDTKAVSVQWSVEGNASLAADPPVKGLGDLPACGQRIVPASELPPSGKATLTLTATKLFRDPVRAAQVVAHAGDPQTPQEPIGPASSDVTCDEERREVIAPVAFEASEYDERVVVLQLRNLASRPVTVSHRGRTWTIPARQSVDLVPREGAPDRGVMTGGTWILRAPLLEGERCGTPSVRPALSIALQPVLGCTPGGAR